MILLLAALLVGADAPRPNVVIVMADDMGLADVGCYGAEIHTPHLDRLAAGGVRMRQFYNGGRCCPTRAALLTGVHAHQAGVGHMVGRKGDTPAYQGFLRTDVPTIAERLKKVGYRTLLSGKWHVGEQRPHWPIDRGFDRSWGLISGASNYWRLDPQRTMADDDREIRPDGDGFFMTDAFTDHAVDMVRDAGEEPFLLYVPYTAPHWPLHARPETIARYEGMFSGGWSELRERRLKRMRSIGLADDSWQLSDPEGGVPDWSRLPEKQRRIRDHRMAVYAAQITEMDAGVGRIVAALEESGRLQDTLILFLADNGACAERINRGTPGVPAGPADSFLSYGVGWANAGNTPLRWYKHSVHEGGISSPLIAHWPAGLPTDGRWCDGPGHVIDLAATIMPLAGADADGLEGIDLMPVLHGEPVSRKGPLCWEHEGHRAVRRGDWKLVSRFGQPWELFDIAADRAETNDRARDYPERRHELEALWQNWARRVGVVPWETFRRKR